MKYPEHNSDRQSPELTIAEINDVLRTVWCGVNVLFHDSVNSAFNKEKIIRAVQDYRFQKDDDCIEHNFGIVEVEGQQYFFSMAGTTLTEGVQEEVTKTVVTIGRSEKICVNFFRGKKFPYCTLSKMCKISMEFFLKHFGNHHLDRPPQ